MTEPIRMGSIYATFDTEALLERIRQAKMLQAERLEANRNAALSRQRALADIRTKLANLLSRAEALARPTSALVKMAQTQSTAISVTVAPSASLGSFTVDVLKLATATTVTGSALSAGVNATAPMDQANFGLTPTYGTFTIGTSGGGIATLTIDSTDVVTSAPLASSNFAVAVTAGTFTIATETGGSATITVDPTTQSLDDVLAAINSAGIGVTAQVVAGANGKLNSIRLTSAQGAITLGAEGDTSNFLSATNLVGSSGTTERTSTRGVAVMQSLQETIDQINAAGVGITAALVNDAEGRPNIVRLTSTAGDIVLGNATDTSNFLNAVKLLASPGTTTRESTGNIGRLDPSKPLAQAALLAGAPAAGPQSFTINGVSINYDSAIDSLNAILDRINRSAAGVTARYDALTDRVVLEQRSTGSMPITLADNGSGDLLAKLGLLSGTQTLGENAEYRINGGPVQYSASNTADVLPGISLTFQSVTEPGSPAEVRIVQHADAVVASVKAFVDAFNATVSAIDQATKSGEKSDERGILSGDWGVRQLKSSLRAMVTGPGLNLEGPFPNLASIGITFGAIGSQVGTTNTLQLDEAKLRAAIEQDAAGVQSLFSTWNLQATLMPGGTGSITGISGSYSGTKAGRYQIIDDGAGALIATFYPADGSAPTETRATVAAGGSTTTLIPGLTVTVSDPLQAGQHTILVQPAAASPIQQLKAFLEGQARTGGSLQAREDAYQRIAEDIARRKEAVQERIDREIERLRQKFIAMDQALARSQRIFDALTQMANQLANIARPQR